MPSWSVGLVILDTHPQAALSGTPVHLLIHRVIQSTNHVACGSSTKRVIRERERERKMSGLS